MRNTLLLLSCLVLAANAALAQDIWHKKLPATLISAAHCRLSSDGDQYFVHTNKDFIQLDEFGTVTGTFKQESQPPFLSFVEKKYSAATGHPYFMVVHRRLLPSPQGYTLTEYLPGTGFVNETMFADSLGNVSWLRPQVVKRTDSTYVVFGRLFFRKIKHLPGVGFTEEWVKPLNTAVTAALFENNRYVIAGETGIAAALDENGDLLWSRSHSVAFRSLKVAPGGFIGCGRTFDGSAVVIKLDQNGEEIWRKVTTDIEYWDVINTFGGGYAITGLSDTSTILLSKIDSNGTSLWEHEYGTGTGLNVLQTQDGGFVLAARTSGTSVRLIKTDADGDTKPGEDVFINNRQIKTSGVQATLDPSPSLFFDGNDATFIIPPDSGVPAIFVFSPWIGGMDESNELHLAANDFFSYTKSDYRTGLTQSNARDFNRVWLVNQDEIDRVRFDYGVDKQLDGPVPFDLLTWPAKGNPHLKYNLDFTPVEVDPALLPAPFVDANNDGLYNVYDGDYPRIKGDQMAWWALTDSTEHLKTQGNVLGLDLLVSSYAFDCAQNSTIEKSLYVDFEVINQSQANYQNTHLGFFTDPEVGCYEDDLFGSLPDVDTYYAYNADNFDNNCPGQQGYGSNIPVQTITFMNHSLEHFNYFFPVFPDPALPQEYYNILQGKWGNGDSLTVGGTGYNPGSTNFTSYAFPDNPADPDGWSMCVLNYQYVDWRVFGGHGPFSFSSGDTFKITTAFMFHPDIPHPCPDIFGLVKPKIEALRQWSDDGSLSATVDLGQVVNLSAGQSATLDASVPGASYLWSTGATTPVISVAAPGNYSVSVTLATGCQVTEEVLVQLNSSLHSPDLAPLWNVQPNPAKDFVTVECGKCADGALWAVLRNAQGAALLTLQGQNHPFQLETQHQPSGFYWLELWQGEQFLGSKKLVLSGH